MNPNIVVAQKNWGSAITQLIEALAFWAFDREYPPRSIKLLAEVFDMRKAMILLLISFYYFIQFRNLGPGAYPVPFTL